MGDPNEAKSFELDRSTSRRASTRLSHVLGDNDDYDLLAMAISDGFRPVEVANNHNHNVSHSTRPSVSSLEPPTARAMSPRPSSVSKPAAAHDSYPVPHAGLERAGVRSSTTSNDPVMATETPYEGPSGPSHPYQMYPQDVRLARTASLATTSTAPISERSYNGPRRPTHPYGIYPQNVGTIEDGSGDRSAQRDINVGFPGRTGNYERRLGPDGEEVADMIGPDGHTEQLPPYTRYPVEAYAQKALGINTTQSTPTPPPPAQQRNLEIPGAGGIGLATRNPEFSSTEDLNQLSSPQSRRSIRSFTSEASHHSINTAALAVTNEKSTPTWKTAARRKVWGVVPCWAVVLGVIVLVMLGVVVGTVIGTVIAPKLNGGDHKKKPPYPASNSAPGFIPLSTVPPGLPPLAEGLYSLPLLGPRFSNTCFQDPRQGRAWNCDAIMSQLTMTIIRRPNALDIAAYALDFTYNSSYTKDTFVYMYGVQPPSLIDQQLQLVNDTFERSRGAAWAFALPYNKTVILPEEYLTPYSNATSDPVQRRMMFGFDFKRKGLAQSGEKPWICTWPGTVLEVFIYAGQNNSFKYPMYPSSTSDGSRPTETSNGAPSNTIYRRDPMGHYDPFPHSPFPTERPTSSPVSSSVSSSLTHTSSEEPDYFKAPPMIPPPFPPYPRVIKVEERRNPEIDTPAPICQQVEIIGPGIEARPVKNDDGHPIEIQIAEVMADDEDIDPYLLKRSNDQQLKSRDDDDGAVGDELSDCGCIWWVT
jgi:hypothetical protein